MSMNTLIGKVCSKAVRRLYNIRQIRKYLSAESTKCLIHAFVTSHLDYCNAFLYKLPQYQYDRLQKVLNAVTRVTCLIPKFAHSTPVLRELHWLPVKFRNLQPGVLKTGSLTTRGFYNQDFSEPGSYI